MTWTYGIKIFDSEDIDNNYGFVYIITNTINNRKYVGKKWFWSSRKKKIKGKKRAKRVKLESDWKDYYGSSAELRADVEKYGKESFKREILVLCKTKSDATYHEARLQFEMRVLESDEYYNKWIFCRIRKSNLV
jgi:Putative endonuclease segE, GIY-YIG domain